MSDISKLDCVLFIFNKIKIDWKKGGSSKLMLQSNIIIYYCIIFIIILLLSQNNKICKHFWIFAQYGKMRIFCQIVDSLSRLFVSSSSLSSTWLSRVNFRAFNCESPLEITWTWSIGVANEVRLWGEAVNVKWFLNCHVSI
jgi:hypothetical protein